MTRDSARHLGTVTRDLRNRGFTVQPDEWGAVARGASLDHTSIDAPLAVLPLADGQPLAVVSAVAHATCQGYVPVLVAAPQTRTAAQDILSTPFALAGTAAGRRQFYAVEDRVRLTDDTFACVATRGALQWVEASTRAETDAPRLHLTVGDDIVAVLDSASVLTCPGPTPATFPVRYTRSEHQFRVLDTEGVIETYGTIASMRADGYRPVPLPLIPDHHIREDPSLARATLLAVPDGDGVSYESIQ